MFWGSGKVSPVLPPCRWAWPQKTCVPICSGQCSTITTLKILCWHGIADRKAAYYTQEMPIGIVHTLCLVRSAIEFTQLDVVTSQFVMFIPCALHARIKDGTGSRHVNQTHPKKSSFLWGQLSLTFCYSLQVIASFIIIAPLQTKCSIISELEGVQYFLYPFSSLWAE